MMMRAARFLTTVFATGSIAFASGYIVQNGDATAAKIGASLQSPGMARASVLPDAPILPRPPIETLQATPLPTTQRWVAAMPESLPINVPDLSGPKIETAIDCDTTMRATSGSGGMIRISLNAPCATNAPVTLRHAGLSFTETTTDAGRLSLEIPALVADATVQAVMPNGQSLSANAYIQDAVDYYRVALVWRGDGGLHIHAQENGATLGSAGHIWAGSPGRADLGADAKGGHLMTYGDRKLANATMAEVYSYPAAVGTVPGVVRLTVQAEIRNTNCDGVIAAQTLQPDGLGGIVTAEMTLRLPECDQIGEHLVLKNLLRDLKIASN